MAMKRKPVTIQVGNKFFEKLFEPSRKRMQDQLGTKVSQAKFSDMIFNSGMKFDIKLNNKVPKVNGKKKTKKK